MGVDLKEIERRTLWKYPLFGSILANVKIQFTNKVKRAATDGRNILLNQKYFSSITEEQQVFVLSHEICHIAFNHILRSEGKHKKLWNKATDAVINQLLKRDGLPFVKNIVDIAEAIQYDAEEMYEKLLEEQKQKEQDKQKKSQQQNEKSEQENQKGGESGEGGQGEDGEQEQQDSGDEQQDGGEQEKKNNQQKQDDSDEQEQGDGGDSKSEDEKEQGDDGGNGQGDDEEDDEDEQVGHDDHSMWDEAVKKYHQGEKEEKESETGTEENQEEGTEKISEKEAFKENKELKKQKEQEYIKKLREEAEANGDTSEDRPYNSDNIGESNPLLDWRRVLERARVRECNSKSSFVVRYGVLRPITEERRIEPETEIVLDTSGSINEDFLRAFLRETKNILGVSKVKVGCFDTKFMDFQTLKPKRILLRWSLKAADGLI